MSTSSITDSPVSCRNRQFCLQCYPVRLATDQSKIPNQTKWPDSKRKTSTQTYTKVEAPISVFTLPVSEPFLLKLRSKFTDKEFRTKIHYYSCQANYVLTAWDFVTVRKSIFTWKTEVCSTKLKTRKLGADWHGLHVFICWLIRYFRLCFN